MTRQLRILALAAVSGLGAIGLSAQTRTPSLSHLYTPLPLVADAHGHLFGDFDRDGVDDYLALTLHGPRLALSSARGGERAVARTIRATAGPATAGAIGDVNGDGRLDVVVGDTYHQRYPVTAAVLIQRADGTFEERPINGLGVDPTRSIALGDVDGDGDLDAYFGKSAILARQDYLLLNDGAGHFTVSSGRLPGRTHDTREVRLVDIDGDGDLDVIKANHGQNDSLYQNDGRGYFRDIAGIPAAAHRTRSVDVADFDRDGDLDLLFAGFPESTGPGDRLLLQDRGRFVPRALPTPQSTRTYHARFGDLDGDGDLDIVRFTDAPQSTAAVVLENTGAGFTEHTPFPLGVGTQFALRDLDDDGDLDLVTSAGRAGHRLFENRGGLRFDRWRTMPPTIGSDHSAIGDLDGDGIPEVVAFGFGESSTKALRVLHSDGDGRFDTARVLSAVTEGAIGLGDFDGDGDLDLVTDRGIVFGQGRASRIYWNDGRGAFSTSLDLPATTAYPTTSFEVADLDGDNDRDILVLSTAGAPYVLRNNGSSFSAHYVGPIAGRQTHGAVGDLDGDGDPDLILSGGAGRPSYISYFRNDGNLRFGRGTIGGGPNFENPVVGDFDGDGDLDAATGITSGVQLWENRRGASLVRGTFVRMQSLGLRALAAGDVDGDGRVDLVATSRAYRLGQEVRQETTLLRGLGNNRFQPIPSAVSQTTLFPNRLDLVDLDDDGDLDLLHSAEFSVGAHYNLHRHLSWRTQPRLGRTMALELNGTPNASWALAIGVGPRALSLPPLGTLRIGMPLAIVNSGRLGAQGRFIARIPVPMDPVIGRTDLRAQAVFGSSPRLGNALRLSISGN